MWFFVGLQKRKLLKFNIYFLNNIYIFNILQSPKRRTSHGYQESQNEHESPNAKKTQMKQKSQGNEQPTSLNICFDDPYSLSPNMDLSNEMIKNY